MVDEPKQREINKNFEVFQQNLPELLETHPNKFAVMHGGQIEAFFDTMQDAMIYGGKEHPDGMFSIQKVTREIVDLGFFSHAVHLGAI